MRKGITAPPALVTALVRLGLHDGEKALAGLADAMNRLPLKKPVVVSRDNDAIQSMQTHCLHLLVAPLKELSPLGERFVASLAAELGRRVAPGSPTGSATALDFLRTVVIPVADAGLLSMSEVVSWRTRLLEEYEQDDPRVVAFMTGAESPPTTKKRSAAKKRRRRPVAP